MPRGGTGAASAPTSRLSVEDLGIVVAANGATVVTDVSFEVPPGGILGLVGESGSGKTSVALALLAYARRGLRISAGRVLLDGEDVLQVGADHIHRLRGARIAYVPQDPASALTPTMRLRSQLAEVAGAHPDAIGEPTDARIARVVEEVRLNAHDDLLSRYPHQLSGGQQQRVAIAMAFMCRPSVIVLDEPTTGLDVTTQRHVLETVKRMCQTHGVAAVYVSHDLAVVAEIVDQVAVMYAGRVMELGATDDVFSRPAHPYTRRLLAAVPSPDRAGTLVGIDGQPPPPEIDPVGCRFAPRCRFRIDACLGDVQPIEVDERLVRCIRARELSREVVTAAAPPRPQGARAEADHVLVVSDLAARYGDHEVLSDLNLTVPRHECVAVVGESGSGKTTLARCIAGLHSSWTGTVGLDGVTLATRARARSSNDQRRVKYIFQNPYTSLNPRKTIEQTLEQPLDHFFSLSRADRQDRILRVLDDVSLGRQMASRYPDQLSGGQRQRVAIARALLAEPELLICDEVTSALDVSVQAVIVELIRQVQLQRQLSVLFITHNIALVRSIAQRCVVLAGGRIVEQGLTETVLSDPQEGYTVRLMEDVPRFDRWETTASD